MLPETPDGFRCSTASTVDAEPMSGTAPTETAYLLIEWPGAFGQDALTDARLPERVRQLVIDLPGVKVQLIRRYGGDTLPGTQIFTALADKKSGFALGGARLESLHDLLDLDFSPLIDGRSPGLPVYDDPLLLVCTNGKRDRCCAEIGRPLAAALADRWPEATWETNHLGGHRFAGTLLSFPSGYALGRLWAEDAVSVCERLLRGEVPAAYSRGRAGLPAAAQVARDHLAQTCGRHGTDDVVVTAVAEAGSAQARGVVEVTAEVLGEPWQVHVQVATSEPARLSCGDLKRKPVKIFKVVSARPVQR